jgi:hypothetical protein
LDKLKAIAEKLTPKLREALEGPLQGQVLNYVFKRMKVSNIQEVENKLTNDPSSIKELKQAEQDYVDLTDTPVSIRKRDDVPLIAITIIYNIGYFALLGLFVYMTFGQVVIVDEWVKGIIGTLIGVLTAQLPTINGYWFGSSAGSARKTDALADKIKS